MRPLRSLFLWAAAALCLAACGTASDDAVIPHPASVEELPGSFRIHAPMALSVEAPVEAAEALTGYLKTTPLPIDTAEPDAAKNYLRLELSDDERIPASEEGYVLSVRPAGITIAARPDSSTACRLCCSSTSSSAAGFRHNASSMRPASPTGGCIWTSRAIFSTRSSLRSSSA